MSQSINKRHLLVNRKFLLRHCQQDGVAGIKRRNKILLRQKCKPERILTCIGKQFIIDFFDRFNKLMISLDSHDFDKQIAFYYYFYEISTLCQITVNNLISASVGYAMHLCERQFYMLLFEDTASDNLRVIDFKKYLLRELQHGETEMPRDMLTPPRCHEVMLRLFAIARESYPNLQDVRTYLKDLVHCVECNKLIDFLCGFSWSLSKSWSSHEKFNGFVGTQELARYLEKYRTNNNLTKLIKYIKSDDMEFLLAMYSIHIGTIQPKFIKTYSLLFYVMTGSTYQFNKNDSISGNELLHTFRLEKATN